MRRPYRPRRGEKILEPVRPSAAIEAAYRKKLVALVDEMHRSVDYWLRSAYRNNEPVLAADERPLLPANALQAAVQKMARRWLKRFDKASEELAAYFLKSVHKRTDRELMRILDKGGWTVELHLTRQQRDVLNASIHENVALIKSIPQQYLTQVEGMVMRSVSAGRDLSGLTKDLQKQYGVTRRRAAFIARDQNNKASAALQRSRQIELGITTALWIHSHAGKTPRPTHLANDGKTYDTTKGWYDPAVKQWIFPGQLPNCRCFSRAIVKGFS